MIRKNILFGSSPSRDPEKGSLEICGRKIQRAGVADEGMGVGLETGMKGEGALSLYSGTPVGVESLVGNAFMGGSVAYGRKIRRARAGDEGMGVGLGRGMKGEGRRWVASGKCRRAVAAGGCSREGEGGGLPVAVESRAVAAKRNRYQRQKAMLLVTMESQNANGFPSTMNHL
ncbi:hypothetical protein ACLOJK_015318 [Asimina triloba]